MIENIQHIFSAGITICFLKNIDNESIIKYAEKTTVKNNKKNIEDILKNNIFYDLNNIVQSKMQKYFETIYSKKYNIILSAAWANVDNDDFITIPHVHTDGVISAVYYPLSTDGKLVFLNPMLGLLSKQSVDIIEKYNEFNSEHFEIPVKTGYLIIFNSMLQHHILYSKQKRISIAYNGVFKKNE